MKHRAAALIGSPRREIRLTVASFMRSVSGSTHSCSRAATASPRGQGLSVSMSVLRSRLMTITVEWATWMVGAHSRR